MPERDPQKGTPKPEGFVDESGSTSVEPEGAGKHPHREDVYPDPDSKQRWEYDLGGEPGGEESGRPGFDGQTAGEGQEVHARGPKPVEGDGDGAPL